MRVLTNEQKAMMLQCAINCYTTDGIIGHHGALDWSFYKGGYKGATQFDFDNSEGHTAVINVPGVGEAGVVVYEGSSGDKDGGVDWKKNFDTKLVNDVKDAINANAQMQVPYENSDTKIRMHKGFAETYLESREFTRDFAKWCYKNGLPYFVTGHSLGGACTTLDFIDKQHMFGTEMSISPDKLNFLTGYAAATPAVFNLEGAQSFNKRADGNFFSEWFGNDTVHDTPPLTGMGYVHVNAQKRWSSFMDDILFAPTHILQWITFGFLPSVGAWDHDPRRLLAAIQGRPIPWASDNSNSNKAVRKY